MTFSSGVNRDEKDEEDGGAIIELGSSVLEDFPVVEVSLIVTGIVVLVAGT
jgi:hypothetical protein